MSFLSRSWGGPSYRYYLFWVVMCALAELLGIAVGAIWWVWIDRFDPEPATATAKWLSLAGKSLSGVGEGIALGGLQAFALRRVYPRLRVTRWVIYTTLLAVAGWAVGSSIPIFAEFSSASGDPFDPPLVPLTLASGALGAGLGALFGWVQQQALNAAAHNTYWWIVANACGWGLALPVIYVAASIGEPGAPVSSYLLTGLSAGLIAGLVLGAVTGLSFWKMAPRR